VDALLAMALMYCVSVVVKVKFPEYSVASCVTVDMAVVIGQVLLLVETGLADVTPVPEE